MRAKLATAAVALPLLFVLLYCDGWALFLAALAAVLIGLHEFYSALLRKNIVAVQEAGWLGSLGVLGATQFARPEWRSGIITACIAGVVFMALIAQFWRRKGTSVIANAGATVFGVVYIALLFSYLLRLRQVSLQAAGGAGHETLLDRLGAVLLVIGAVWLMDVAANVVGRLFGTKRPWPTISPNKTWEGALAGLLASMVAALVIGGFCRLPVLHVLVLGIGLGIVGQIGDFCESLLKRDLDLKDFGSVLPGHGGVLDRFDSLLFGMPVAYYYLTLVVLAPQ